MLNEEKTGEGRNASFHFKTLDHWQSNNLKLQPKLQPHANVSVKINTSYFKEKKENWMEKNRLCTNDRLLTLATSGENMKVNLCF